MPDRTLIIDTGAVTEGFVPRYNATLGKWEYVAPDAHGVHGGGGGNHNILSVTHPDTVVGSVAAGDLVTGDATPKWARLAKGAVGEVLKAGSSILAWGSVAFSEITGIITDAQHGSRGGALHSDSHAQLHQAAHQSGGGDAQAGNLDAVAKTTVRKNTGADVGSRRRLNLIEGANVTLTIADDGVAEEVDVTIAAAGGGGAPTDADYLVGTANPTLSAEIVVGTAPGGELGGTWAAPTVDAIHSGSAHYPDPVPAHEAATDPHVGYQKESEKGAASGYAGLGADAKVPDAQSQVPSTHPGATTGIHGAGASTIESASGSQAKVDTHAGLTTAHAAATNLEKAANKGAASGYAGLDAGTKVPTAQLGGAGAGATNFLRGDQSWATPAGGGMNTLKKTADQIINGTAFQNITDLTFPISANTDYAFKFHIVFRSAATTTGFRFAINGPAGAVVEHFMTYQTVANSETVGVATWLQKHSVTFDAMTVLTATIAAGVDLVCMIEGRIKVGGTGGTLAARVASELANNDLVVQKGSWGFWF